MTTSDPIPIRLSSQIISKIPSPKDNNAWELKGVEIAYKRNEDWTIKLPNPFESNLYKLKYKGQVVAEINSDGEVIRFYP